MVALGHLPAPRQLLFVLALALASASTCAAGARAEVVALDRLGAAAPVLWNGGVAWQDPQGVHAAAPGTASHAVVSFQARGFTYGFALDSGSGAAGPAGSSGALAYGWVEANEMTPPMGPGDTRVPPPPLPYETSVLHRGVIGAEGHVTQLPACGAENVPVSFGAYEVSMAGTDVAYRCEGAPPGAQAPADAILPSYLALGELAMPGSTTRTIAEAGTFQISGNYLAYYRAGKPPEAGRVVVENRQTGTVGYEAVRSAKEGPPGALALQEDGTLVVLGTDASPCATGSAAPGQTYPAAWFSPASPVAHQLGCFYDGSLRPAGGQWVALRPAGAGTATASLVLLSLATGVSQTLATFANAGVFEPQQQPLAPGADFNGRRLAWTEQTCAGTELQLTTEVSAMSPVPGPLPSTRCAVRFAIHGALHVNAKGNVSVAVSCPQGCRYGELSIAQPRALRQAGWPSSRCPPRPCRTSRRCTCRGPSASTCAVIVALTSRSSPSAMDSAARRRQGS